jgi:biotin carboxyl carrier protein
MSDTTDPRVLPTLEIDDTVFETRHTRKFAKRTRYAPRDPRKILCFIPGIIRKIHVAPGRKIKRGDHLLILEAMKMQNDISSPEEGTVKKVHVAVGQMVTKGQLLIEFE